MSNKNDGGQVYPSEQGQDAEGKWNQTYEAGITRRDWLAGLAMQGMAGREFHGTMTKRAFGVPPGQAEDRFVEMARWAYALADALIAEGKR